MEYMYFTFDGIPSSKYNLYIMNNGEDLSYPSQPGFENQLVGPLYQGTNFLAGVNEKERIFSFNCWVDSLKRDAVIEMLEWLSVQKVGKLILDYNPNYYYNVKINTVGDFKHMAINEDGTVNYEFQMSFITIGDFAAISRTEFKINQLTNPLNNGGVNDDEFLNPDNLAPIGIWNAATSSIKLFNYGSKPIYPYFNLQNSTSLIIKKNNVVYYQYSGLPSGSDPLVDTERGFTKVGNVLAEAVPNVIVNSNALYTPMSIESGKPQVIYGELTNYAANTLTFSYDDEVLNFTDTTDLYLILQDGDYGYELLTQEMTEAERQLYISKAINEQYNKINKDGSNSDIEVLSFNTDQTYVVSTPGQIGWDQEDGTFNMHLLDSVVLQSGQELHVYGKIQGSFDQMDLMQFAGVQGDHLLFKRAVPAEIAANPELLVGIATTGLLDGNFSYITWFGKVRNVNTYPWVAGTILYFDPSTGQLTATKPTAPNRKITVAVVIKQATSAAANNGILMVRPHVGARLEDLDNVYINNPQDGQILKYNATAGYWYNAS